jgi:hypothetical protein
VVTAAADPKPPKPRNRDEATKIICLAAPRCRTIYVISCALLL